MVVPVVIGNRFNCWNVNVGNSQEEKGLILKKYLLWVQQRKILDNDYFKEEIIMVSKKVTVVNEQGMHMRPAGELAKVVKLHPDCDVILNANGKSVKAKAPMQIMSACMKKGCEVEIVCDGANEQTVLNEIVAMFENGFGE